MLVVPSASATIDANGVNNAAVNAYADAAGAGALTAAERAQLDGSQGSGTALAMRLVVRAAEVTGAARLLPITGAHVVWSHPRPWSSRSAGPEPMRT